MMDPGTVVPITVQGALQGSGVLIQGTDEVLPPGRWWLKPAKVTIKAIGPVYPKSCTAPHDHRLIRKNVKQMMIQSLSEMDLNKRMGNANEPRSVWGS